MSNAAQTLTVDQARGYIIENLPRMPAGQYVLLHEALNRVCAKKVVSAYQIPAYDNSAMDGYAFKYSDAKALGDGRITLPVIGVSLAGQPYHGKKTNPVGAVRVTTGGFVPPEYDTVIPYEKTQFTDTEVTFDPADIKQGANIRKAGEEINKGDEILSVGTRLNPSHIALLASVGVDRVMVYDRLKVTLIATGDELSEPGHPLSKCGVFNSGAHGLIALLTGLGCDIQYEGIVKDDPNMVALKLRQAKENGHIILITGGAADSTADYAHQQLALLGEIAPWTINMRPGRPMRFAKLGSKPVFLLPGNPVASFVTFLEFAAGAIRYMQGQNADLWPLTQRAVAGVDIKKKKGRAEFMRGKLTGYYQAAPVVEPLGNQSSASFTSMSQAEVIICLDAEDDIIHKGDRVKIQLLSTVY
ncbi:MAG: molybdopterin molybdotransferase MoeA [Sutterellaceae bacterium]|nr:molybdopterin molybdotransferase MoeA [Sutterellaceae bacterium]